MTPTLNLFASKFKCIICRKESTVTGTASLACSNCGAQYTTNFKTAVSSGIGAAGLAMAIGTGLLHARPMTAGIVALLAGFVVWRAFFEVVFDSP